MFVKKNNKNYKKNNKRIKRIAICLKVKGWWKLTQIGRPVYTGGWIALTMVVVKNNIYFQDSMDRYVGPWHGCNGWGANPCVSGSIPELTI